MIEANRPPVPVVTAEPASPSATAGADDASAGSVNLGRRFFNVKTGLSFLLGIVILLTLLRVTNVDFSEVLAQVGRMNPRVYAMAVVCYILTFPFRGFRWQRLLSNVGTHLPAWQLTEVIFISWFVNSVLPGKVGDVYRGYLLRREHGLSLSRTVGTVVAERIIDLFVLILLLGGTGFLVLRHRTSPTVDYILQAGWVGLAVLIVGVFVVYRFGERLVAYLPENIQGVYAKFAHGTFSSLSSARGLPILAILTLLAWGAEAGRLYFVMRSLHLDLGPQAALFTVAAISLALIVPTPGGLGGVEAAFAGVLAVFGVPLQIALAVALLDRLISYYSLIVFGLPTFLFTRRGR